MASTKPVVKEGKVVSANRKFYVMIGRARTEIPTGALVDAASVKALVGKTVPVTIYGKSVVAIGPRPGIICYIPVDPSLFKLVQPDLQQFLEKKYTDAGILTAG
jgi:hypothetical protein